MAVEPKLRGAPPGPGAAEGRASSSARKLRWPRWLPPVRLAWMGLAILVAYGSVVLQGITFLSVATILTTCVAVDLGFQKVRFRSLRVPDAALATGLFLALILPPTLPAWVGIAVALCAITIRHAFRYQGRPLFNPAATGVVLGALLFGAAPAWWVAVGPVGAYLMGAIGLLLLVRSPRAWRIPAIFLGVYAAFAVVDHLLFGASVSATVLVLTVVDPAVVFLGLFMLVEPRTAPASPFAHPMYAALAALGAVFLSIVFPTLGALFALLAANLLSVALRRPHGAGVSRARRVPRSGEPRAQPTWTARQRASVGAVVLVMVTVLALATAQPTSTPSVLVTGAPHPGGGGPGSIAACAHDNASIPTGTLSTLHRALGPSVILSYNPATGAVVFYDPANQVTVTETDLYEDYGYAEFNGDDFAVAGCAP